MSSDEKIEANRQNAKKSTGPRTTRGKSHSRGNALTTGIYSWWVLPGEHQDDYDAILASLVRDLRPIGLIEEMHVTQIARNLMRLERTDIAERAFFWTKVSDLTQNRSDPYSEHTRVHALHNVLSSLANQPCEGVEEKLNGQRNRIIAEITKRMDALKELQKQRAIDVCKPLEPTEVNGPRKSILGTSKKT